MRSLTLLIALLALTGCHNFNKKYDGDCIIVENDIGTMVKCPAEEGYYIDYNNKKEEVNEETDEM